MNDKLLLTGIVGTIVTALCCFTPLLVWLLAVVGVSAVVAYLDIVLLSLFAFFILIIGIALWKRDTPAKN